MLGHPGAVGATLPPPRWPVHGTSMGHRDLPQAGRLGGRGVGVLDVSCPMHGPGSRPGASSFVPCGGAPPAGLVTGLVDLFCLPWLWGGCPPSDNVPGPSCRGDCQVVCFPSSSVSRPLSTTHRGCRGAACCLGSLLSGRLVLGRLPSAWPAPRRCTGLICSGSCYRGLLYTNCIGGFQSSVDGCRRRRGRSRRRIWGPPGATPSPAARPSRALGLSGSPARSWLCRWPPFLPFPLLSSLAVSLPAAARRPFPSPLPVPFCVCPLPLPGPAPSPLP